MTEQQLAAWARSQKSNCSDPRKRALLEQIPGWEWGVPFDVSWNECFTLLSEHGVNLSYDILTKRGIKVRDWVNRQKRLHALKNTDLNLNITKERTARLETIPGWEWDADAIEWRKGYLESVKHGVVGVKFKTPDGFELGKWQEEQRNNPSKFDGRRARLENFVKGWNW